MTTTNPTGDSGSIALTWEQRDLLRAEVVAEISGDAIGDYLDKGDHYDWARSKRAKHELAFKLLDDLEWTTEPVWWDYKVRPHDGLAEWLKDQLRVEKQMLLDDQRQLVAVRDGMPHSVWPGETDESTAASITKSRDEGLDRVALFTYMLAELGWR